MPIRNPRRLSKVGGKVTVDLSKDVTVWLITCGEPTTADARSALRNQNSSFLFGEITNEAPMSRAFQAMIDHCETRFYVEVDADMILRADGVQALYSAMLQAKAQNPKCAMVAMGLWDRHAARPIIGCKIYDRRAFQDYPYRDVQGCETDQLSRMKNDGWSYLLLFDGHASQGHPCLVGEHVTANNPWQAFERYRDLMVKHRKYKHSPWIEVLPKRLLEKICEPSKSECKVDIDSPDLWALIGFIVGVADPLARHKGEKDARTYEKDEVYKNLRRLLGRE